MGRAVVGAYRVGAATARVLPERVALRTGDALGAIAGRAGAGRRAQVERNLRRIYGHDLAPEDLQARVRATFRSYARYWVESFRLPSVSAEELDAGIRVDGWHHIQDGLDAGAGVILALPHLGGWEWAGFWLATVQKREVTVVVEPLEPPELFDWFAAFRTRLGMHVVPLGPNAGTD